jgi:NAD(P)-dependent dehydrogenase (short-subunit alcohol dehydrogenase family)
MPGLLYPLVYGNKYTSKSVPDLSGKVMIVTGGNNGIGYQTVIHLVRAGAKVYMGARTESKARAAIKEIEAMNLRGQVIFLKLDLMDFTSARTAAREFSSKEERLDVLFNNAGIFSTEKKSKPDADGLEATIKTNHFAPFLFTHLLLPKLQKSSEPRIVLTSSTMYEMSKVKDDSFTSVDTLNLNGTSEVTRYCHSKLANLLFAISLSKKHPNILSNACHPGLVATDMGKNIGGPFGSIASILLKGLVIFFSSVVGFVLNPPEGALTQTYLGTSPEVAKKQINGKYFVPIATAKNTKAFANEANAEKLWQTTEAYFKARNISLEL